jgi:hypothetical protein
MYHIGMIQSLIFPEKNGVISADSTIQGVVSMWDGNILIISLEKKIARHARKGQYVLIDYTPLSPESRHRRMTIVKIIPESEGSRIWADFQDVFEKRRVMMERMQQRYIR